MNAINVSTTHKKNVIRIVLATAIILSIPLIAMQFTEEVDWRLPDFIVISTLFFGAGMVYEFGVKKVRTTTWQVIAAVVLLIAVLLIWAELAVGVFGSVFAGS